MNAEDRQLEKFETLDIAIQKNLKKIELISLTIMKSNDPKEILDGIHLLQLIQKAAEQTREQQEAVKKAAIKTQYGFRRLGEYLTAMPKHKGGRPGKNRSGVRSGFLTLKELKLKDNDSAYCQKIAKLPDWAFKRAVENPYIPSRTQMEKEVKRFEELAHLVEEDCLRPGGLKESEKEKTMERFYLEGYSPHQAEVELTGKREEAEDVDYGTGPDDDDPVESPAADFLAKMKGFKANAESMKQVTAEVEEAIQNMPSDSEEAEEGFEIGVESLKIFKESVQKMIAAFKESRAKMVGLQGSLKAIVK